MDNADDARREIGRRVWNLPIPHEEEPQHSMLTVLVRPGLCVFGPQESPWFNAWKYSNHLRRVFGSEFILVTEHGWRDFMTDCAGRQPALVNPPVRV